MDILTISTESNTSVSLINTKDTSWHYLCDDLFQYNLLSPQADLINNWEVIQIHFNRIKVYTFSANYL